MSALRQSFVAAILFVLSAIPAVGQGAGYFDEPGIPAFTTSLPVENGFINLANGNLHLEIPIASYPQRGSLKALRPRLVYDSRFWIVRTDPVSEAQTWQPNGTPIPSSPSIGAYAWNLITDGEIGETNESSTPYICGYIRQGSQSIPLYAAKYDNYIYQEPNGTMHRFPIKLTKYPSGGCGTSPGSASARATDGSGFLMNVVNYAPASVYAPDGKQVVTPTLGTYLQDPNGNFYSMDANHNVIDTLGRVPVIVTTSGNQVFLDYLCEQGCNSQNSDRARVTITLQTIDTATNFGQSGVGEYTAPASSPAALILIHSIGFPNGTSYVFQYDSYGQITSVTLPTGGVITYGYQNFADYSGNVNRWVNSMLVAGQTWTITPTLLPCSTPPCTQQVTVTTPPYNDGTSTQTDDRVYTFLTNNIGSGNSTASGVSGAWNNQVRYFRGSASSGKLIVTENIDYGVVGPTGIITPGVLGGPPAVIRRTLIWPTASGTLNKKTEYNYDGFLNVTAAKQWGYQANGSFAASPDRETDIAYLADSNSNYANANLLRLVQSNTVVSGGGTAAQTTYGYDETIPTATSSLSPPVPNHNSAAGPRGNLTTVSKWLNTTSTFLSTKNTYDDTGNFVSTLDPRGNTTLYSYADNYSDGVNRSSLASLTKTTDAANHNTSTKLDFNTGLQTSSTDQNSQTTSYSYDNMFRSTGVNYPDGGATSSSYNDNPATGIFIAHTRLQTAGSWVGVDTTWFDSLGRNNGKILLDPEGYDYSGAAYDALGRAAFAYDPAKLGVAQGTTQTQYDSLGRVNVVTKQDGSKVQNSYAANCVTITDEAGKQRKSCSDGLGDVTRVWEDPNGLNYETDYSYDVLGNLTKVVQNGSDSTKARIRTFTYDSLSRLITSANPESGTICYGVWSSGNCINGYDANGNLVNKTAPAPNQTGTATVTTAYTYDVLNRVTQKSYSDGMTPTTYFAYDSGGGWGVPVANMVGRLSEVWTDTTQPWAAEIFSYDAMGRITMNDQCTPLSCGHYPYSVNYTYDLMGDMTTYSTGVANFSQTFDTLGRVIQLTSNVSDANHPGTLATVDSNAGYYASSQLRKVTFGNGLTETNAYNARFQPCHVNVNSSGTVLSQCGDSITTGSVQDFNYGFNSGSSDNGNLATFSASGVQSFNRSYVYDALNRLQSMLAPGDSCSGLTWSNDAWGNRTAQTTTGGACYSFNATVNTRNQLSVAPYQYDAAGNLMNDGYHSYTYDAEGRLIKVDGGNTASYNYDGLGRRVRKTVGSTPTDYVYDLSGNVVTELNNVCGNPCWATSYMYLGAKLVAEYKNGTTYFVHSDHLGSTRLMTALNGSVYDNMDYLPYGEKIAGGSGTTHEFTGKERDAESNLDYFGARYYGATFGRFMVPDWAVKATPVPYANFGNPQSLNLYEYVGGNPMTLVDADGHLGLLDFPDFHNTKRENLCHYSDDDPCGYYIPHGGCVFHGLCGFEGGFGHHYIPRAVWDYLQRNSRTARVLNKWTSGPLKNQMANRFDRLHRGYNKDVQKLVEDLEHDLNKSLGDFKEGDFEELGRRMEQAGGDIEKFNQRLQALNPDASSLGEGLQRGLTELGEAAESDAVAAASAGETAAEEDPIVDAAIDILTSLF